MQSLQKQIVFMTFNPQPLSFEPIFKERIWGGTKLNSVFDKKIISEYTGESWELSSIKGSESVVSNGIYANQTLNELIEKYAEEILGTAVLARFGKQFPLLFKYLDAREALSIQVHPNDEVAQKRHQSFGKTEMWYVVEAQENAKIIVGFEPKTTRQKFQNAIANQQITSLLTEKKAKNGDAFFIKTGTVHAIGAGILIAEIQQTSDITYRIYDFDRKDANGNTRELHLDLAFEAIDFEAKDAQIDYQTKPDIANKMIDCQYFTTNIICLQTNLSVSKTPSSFTVYMCVEGSFSITLNQKCFTYQKGDTILIPAVMTHFLISGKATILEIFIK